MGVIHKLFGLARTVFCAVLLLCPPALAQDSVYTVDGVAVDVTAANAVEAREKAFEEAQLKAYTILTERILSVEELAAYTMPEVGTISTLVQDFEVTDEQLSAVRYKGTYTFRFRPGAVQGNFSTAEVSYAAAGRKPVLILPYHVVGSRSVLWSDNNPFMSAWARTDTDQGALVSTVLPLGDLLDVTQVKDSMPLSYDKAMLDKMVGRYQAEEAVILLGEQKPGIGLSISLYSAKTPVPSFLGNVEVQAQPGAPEAMLYDRAVKEVLAVLKQDWKTQTQIDPGQANILKARARFSGVQEWVKLKRTLENVPGITGVKVQGLKPKEAVVQIDYAGDFERLNRALAQAGVNMNAPVSQNPWNAHMPGAAEYELSLAPQRY